MKNCIIKILMIIRMNTLFIPLENENTTIVFIDLNFLYQQPANILKKFKRQINDLHMRCFNVEMIRYSGTLVLATSYLVLNDSLEFILVQAPEIVSSMAVLYVENDKAQLWSVCSSINGQARQLSRTIIQQCQKVLNNISLFIEFFNPYWNRALGLYTSLGFRNPQNVIYQGQERLYLEWNRGSSINRPRLKTSTRDQATQLKVEYVNSIGYNVAVLTFTREQLETLRKFPEQYREYGGGIGVSKSNGSANAANYKAISISDLHVGNFVSSYDPNAYISVEFSTFYSFHTHPTVFVNMIKSILNPPSPNDLIIMYRDFTKGVVKHFVIEQNGIWTIQVDPRSMKIIQDNACSAPSILNLLKRKFGKLETNWSNILQQLADDHLLKNTLINNYLADLNNITWKSLGIDNALHSDQKINELNVPIMLVNYFSWDYLLKENTFEDWTFFLECSDLTYNSLNNISFNFDYDTDLKPILDAIDYVGKLDVDRCHAPDNDLMNTFEEFKNSVDCQDRWDGRELISFLQAHDQAEIVQKIYNGEI